MIITETAEISGMEYIRTYSDEGYYIHGGEPEGDYTEAYDPAKLGRTYTETDRKIEIQEAEADEAEAGTEEG